MWHYHTLPFSLGAARLVRVVARAFGHPMPLTVLKVDFGRVSIHA